MLGDAEVGAISRVQRPDGEQRYDDGYGPFSQAPTVYLLRMNALSSFTTASSWPTQRWPPLA